MELTVISKMPAAKAGRLVAIIDLGEARPLFDPKTAKALPAWKDLDRQKRAGALTSPYLAVDAAPLLYLPADAAKYWDDREKVRILASRAWDAACERKTDELILLLDGPAGAEAAPLAAEGIGLRAYKFLKYKKADPNGKEPAVRLLCPAQGLTQTRERVERQLRLTASINRARDLINEPGSVVTPATMEERARAVAAERGFKIEVFDAKRLEKEGYGGLLAVGRGGEVPPRMIVLRYEPKGAPEQPRLGLVGKGITFDTGGICLKPSARMWEMKGDMSGAAAVLHAMEAIAERGLPLRVTGILVTAQNSIDQKSYLPGDIFRAKNGKTVHVDNTDAEGRLILTDGLCRMAEENVTHLIDVATLTGACIRALGTAVSGVLGNDGFADRVAAVAGEQGEPCWRMPMVEEYRPWLDIDIADVNHMPTSPGNQPYAGTTTATLFLREFVPEGIHWTHLDIAGTAIAGGQHKYYRPGATGIMIRTMTALPNRWPKKPDEASLDRLRADSRISPPMYDCRGPRRKQGPRLFV